MTQKSKLSNDSSSFYKVKGTLNREEFENGSSSVETEKKKKKKREKGEEKKITRLIHRVSPWYF